MSSKLKNVLDNGYYFILPSFIKFIEHAYQYYDC